MAETRELEVARQNRTNCKIRLSKIEEVEKEFDRAQLTLEILAPGINREQDRAEFDENYFKYVALAKQILKDRNFQNRDILLENNEIDRQRNRIALLEAELSSRRDAEIAGLRDIISSRNSNELSTVRTHFPLPKLDLPTFSGGYEEWLGFRDTFVAIIHDDSTIPKVQKFRYLKSYLRDGAARVVENIAISESSYDEAWKLLEDRFNNKRIIIQSHMTALFDLTSPNKESPSCLRNMLDSILRHTRALTVLGQPVEKWDTPLIYLIASKLDKDTRREWERRHHTLLHKESENESNASSLNVGDKNASQENVLKNCHVIDSSMVLLSTAVAVVLDVYGKKYNCRVLLDSGSQPNIMTESLANKLNLRKKRLQSSIEVLNSNEINSAEWVETVIESKTSNFATKLSFLILPKITSNIPSIPINKHLFKIPSHIKLADPHFDIPAAIDILLGAEIFYELLCNNKISLAIPHTSLQNTQLGWVVTGTIYNNNQKQTRLTCNLIRDSLSMQLEKFWKMEEDVKMVHLSNEEARCEKHFVENKSRDLEGKYIVRLPFNHRKEELGKSYEAAMRRFFILERRLLKNEKLRLSYNQFMQEYEDLEHMEQSSSGPNEGYYLPHQAVIRETSLTTKLRVVFDGSAKTNTGISLNETLLVGPTIQSGLITILIRFRQYPVALIADIEKMYRQFWIHPDDRKFQKILWRKNSDEPVKTFQLKTVTYGTSAAPFLAIRCLKELAKDEGSHHPKAAEVLENDFYVDDLVTGAESIEEAQELKHDLQQLTERGGLHLCKWRSNKQEVTGNTDDKVDSRLKLDLEKNSKTLGVMWDIKQDNLCFEVALGRKEPVTSKRIMLSEIAKLYDPLGLVAPVITYAKIKMQELWKTGSSWDDPVPSDILEDYEEYQRQLCAINNWSIGRSIRDQGSDEFQLHGFADASERAFGACIYARSSKGGEHRTTLLCARSRVAPIKTVTIPRLELCAAVLLVRLLKIVKESLRCRVDRVMLWSDSTIALSWIKSSPHLFNIFIANRVAEIHESSSAEMWRHVSSGDNPADAVSRGQMPEDFLNNKLWKSGPEWLKISDDHWPNNMIPEPDQSESRKTKVLIAKPKSSWKQLWSRFSSWKKLTRVMAYCLRFVNKVAKRSQDSEELTSAELRAATNKICLLVQEEEFADEIHELNGGNNLPRRSRLLRLSPIIDEKLIRVGGRIKKALLPFDQQHPILLPSKHPITTLIIRSTHEEYMHAGVNGTLYAIREKFWPIDGRLSVRKIVNRCIKCFKNQPKEVSYIMGNLPKVRVTPSRPFENCGIDYCGPFYVKEKRLRNRGKIKVYAAIFICMSTKAVHVELVGDMSTEMFLGCLRRFFARRGKSKRMYSDNGLNFVGAKNELSDIYSMLNKKENNETIKNNLANQGIEWYFSPPRTPHFGGVWEAAVKSLKTHLKRTVGETLFTYEELYTYMCEVESILNSRPLTPMSNDPNDMRVLTPGHFLVGSSLMTIPSLDFSQTPSNRLSNWQHIQKLKNDLWKRWTREYLNEINVRSKWHTGSPNIIKEGTIVILRDDNLPPLRWSLGRIIQVCPGDDGVIRVVKIKTQNGIYTRGVKLVSPLPINDNY
ncbi:uncharacterized protein LOC127287070 [Leptopilina boulardi]|uniref:uncharacterized protein LOC127287070 n=1 Tax=Leptopilina boulardi TaxID=63433 RepID=UPI0021F5FE2F|nr:uncharacterized protein LOC127287070 [Leptopilina boulardi]